VPPPANDACPGAQVLSPAGGPVTVSGTTTGAGDDSSSCQQPANLASPDVVYAIEVPSKQSLGIDVTSAVGSALYPVLTLRRPGGCSGATAADTLLCAWSDPHYPNRAVYSLGSVEPGTYYLWVDGDFTTYGPFSLRVALGAPVAAPTNDDCQGTIPTLVPGVALTGDTRSAVNHSSGSCSALVGASGELASDVVYRFVLAAPQSVTLQVVPDSAEGSLLRPAVYVRGPDAAACGSAGDQVACQVATNYGGTATLNLPSLAAGTYHVWIDGAGFGSGKFTIKLQ
jgi:hypothetical protein